MKRRVLDENALSWANRGVWAICVAVYLTVFVGGLMSSGDDLQVMAHAVGLTLAAAVLGKVAVGLLGQAALPEEQGPSADQAGPVGSLVDMLASTNVAQQFEDTASQA